MSYSYEDWFFLLSFSLAKEHSLPVSIFTEKSLKDLYDSGTSYKDAADMFAKGYYAFAN